MIEEERIEVLKKRINFFHNSNSKIHVILKRNNWFYNGRILEESADFFILQEDYEGRLPIFYIEVLEIEEYKKKVAGR